MKLNAMRTALAVACLGLLVTIANAGYYTSFEASEGYTDGDINGQLGWTSAPNMMFVDTTSESVAGSGTGRGEIKAGNGFPGVSGTAVTGDAYFTIYYNTSGTEGIQLLVGDEDLNDAHAALYIYTRATGGVLKYQDGSTPKSGPTPPEEGWWAIRADFHWDSGLSQYTTWDLKYAEEGDADWSTIDTGLAFYANDGTGFNYDLASVQPWNRPATGSGDTSGWMLVDEIYIGNEAPTLIPEPAMLSMLMIAGLFGLTALALRRK